MIRAGRQATAEWFRSGRARRKPEWRRSSRIVVTTIAMACAFWTAGCYRAAPEVPEPPPGTSAPSLSEPGEALPPSTTADGAEERVPAVSPGEVPVGNTKEAVPPVPGGEAGNGMRMRAGSGDVSETARAALPPAAAKAVPPSEELPLPRNAPSWAREREDLVYRLEIFGFTMGYARFRFRETVRLEGRETYHLTVRAWTSGLLAVFYPMNDTIEYYLDVETLAPVRQEFTKYWKEDDIATYDQETGSIVYRYRKNGKVRKKVDAVPGVYDPVSAAYYFRTRELAVEEPARPLYAGRKLWEVSAKPLGVETIRTGRGRFDTVMVEPVLRRNGTVAHKGDLRFWMTRDERHVPVRIHATFKKIRNWRLVGELLPDRQGG